MLLDPKQPVVPTLGGAHGEHFLLWEILLGSAAPSWPAVPSGQIRLPACFCKWSFTGTQPHPFYELFPAALALSLSWVAAETYDLPSLKYFLPGPLQKVTADPALDHMFEVELGTSARVVRWPASHWPHGPREHWPHPGYSSVGGSKMCHGRNMVVSVWQLSTSHRSAGW